MSSIILFSDFTLPAACVAADSSIDLSVAAALEWGWFALVQDECCSNLGQPP